MSKQSDLVSVSQGASGDPLFIDTANDRVGVGTSSPAVRLHATGNGIITRLSGSGGDFHGLQIQCSDASASVTKSIFLDALNESGAAVANMLGQVQSDGGSLWSWSTQPPGARTDRRVERLRIDGAGRVTMPYQPAFSAGATGNSSLSVDPAGTFALNLTATNIGDHYNTSTYRFTAPVSGFYHFSAGVYFNSLSNGGDGRCGFAVNGTHPYTGASFVTWLGSNEKAVSLSMDFYLSANDYVTLNNFDGVSTINYWSAHTWFTGYLIG